MKQIIFSIIILFFINFIFSNKSLAQSKVLINEFLIDPPPQTVEIFNSGTESADISDWIIDDSGGTTFYSIPKDSVIFPNQCLVFSGDFNLNKTSPDTVRLINSSQQLIDSFSYKSSSGSGISYYRFPDNDNFWTTGSANLEFYNQTNVSCLITPPPSPTPTLTPALIQPTPTLTAVVLTEAGPTTSPTPQPTPLFYENIYISEVMVNPSTGEKEWVEIYNNNDFSVSLNNWFIDDQENTGSSPKIFSLIINAKSYGVADLTSSMFNNDGDSVRLLDFNKDLKDDFEYQKTESGKTLGRISFESENFCFQEPSKNSVNNPCINPTQTPITLTPTEKIIFPLTTKDTSSNIPVEKDNNFDALVHRSVNYPTSVIQNNPDNGEVLGITSDSLNNSHLLLRTLSAISFSYSLLTIISILFKMKLSYGKNKNFYSSFIRSS
ncbi:MAG: lamin tail domain-containing protein [Patescibacteria group bacterium]|jgi:hypothetical protein